MKTAQQYALLVLSAYFTIQTWRDHGWQGIAVLAAVTALLWIIVWATVNVTVRRRHS